MGEWGRVGETRRHSWHAVRTFTRAIGMALAVCGRVVHGPFVADLPWDGRSCEACLRILERRRED